MFFSSLFPTLAALAGTALANPLLSRRSVSGPKISIDFPDPSILDTGSGYVAYGTNGNGKHVQMATSSDANTWTVSSTDPLPTLGAWVNAAAPNIWAPHVLKLRDGTYVLYYSATSAADTSAHCIGAATSTSPTGPFTPRPDALACHYDQGGAIDAVGFLHPTDGNSVYVAYKVDGNNKGHGGSCNNGVEPIQSTPIMLQQVAADGWNKVGNPVQILDRDAGDGPLVEAPALTYKNGYYFLFFSSGCYSETTYDVSYATATSIAGPYTKAQYPVAPLLVTGDDGLRAPGSISFTADGNKALFHAFLGSTIANGRGVWAGVPTYSGNTVAMK